MVIEYDFSNAVAEMHAKKVKQQVMTRAYRVLLARRMASYLNSSEYKIKWSDFEMIRKAVVSSAVSLPFHLDNYRYNDEDKRFEIYSEEDEEWYLISDPDLAFREIVPNLLWPEVFNLTGIELLMSGAKRAIVFRDTTGFIAAGGIYNIPTMRNLKSASVASFEPSMNHILIQLEARLGLDIHTDEHAIAEAFFAETLKFDPDSVSLQLKLTDDVNNGLCLKYDTVNGKYYYAFNGLAYDLNGHPSHDIGNGVMIY